MLKTPERKKERMQARKQRFQGLNIDHPALSKRQTTRDVVHLYLDDQYYTLDEIADIIGLFSGRKGVAVYVKKGLDLLKKVEKQVA